MWVELFSIVFPAKWAAVVLVNWLEDIAIVPVAKQYMLL